VLSVQAYTRAVPDPQGKEAVDFLWLRREVDSSAHSSQPIRSADASRVAAVLRGLVVGDLTVESVLRKGRPQPRAPRGATRVTFAETLDAGHSVLTVETSDRPGLLLAITLALFRARVQIVASNVHTKYGSAADRFTLAEPDGAPLSSQRRRAVQSAVLGALDDGLGPR
jgi:[protein-PII] uridylyltransferase